jgi:hypothetical protein
MTLLLSFVADRTSATYCLAYLLEEPVSKGLKRLLDFPTTTPMGAEKRNFLSLNRLS